MPQTSSDVCWLWWYRQSVCICQCLWMCACVWGAWPKLSVSRCSFYSAYERRCLARTKRRLSIQTWRIQTSSIQPCRILGCYQLQVCLSAPLSLFSLPVCMSVCLCLSILLTIVVIEIAVFSCSTPWVSKNVPLYFRLAEFIKFAQEVSKLPLTSVDRVL